MWRLWFRYRNEQRQFLKKFLKDSSATKHYPALGEATISGLMVQADDKTGLAKKIEPIIVGGVLENRI